MKSEVLKMSNQVLGSNRSARLKGASLRILLVTFVTLVSGLIGITAHGFTLTGNYSNGWRGPTLKFNLNLSNCPSTVLPAMKKAVRLWNSVSTSALQLKIGSTSSTTTPANLYGGSATDAPTIACDTAFQATTTADQNVVAGVGFVTTSNGYMTYGGVLLNASAGNASVNNMSLEQVAVIVAHELGHALGFGHSSEKSALMYYDASYKQELRLSQDDWDAMTYLYPRNELEGDLMGCGSVITAGGGPRLNSGLIGLLFLFLPLAYFATLRSSRRPSHGAPRYDVSGT
jgi:hypothetical protein